MPSEIWQPGTGYMPATVGFKDRVNIKTSAGALNNVKAEVVNWGKVTQWQLSSRPVFTAVAEDVNPKDVAVAIDVAAETIGGVDGTLLQRGARYGDFTDNAAISQDLKRAMSGCKGWSLLNDVQREALTMIAQKIARILNGDPNYKDNWHDIQGYARLAEERCKSSD